MTILYCPNCRKRRRHGYNGAGMFICLCCGMYRSWPREKKEENMKGKHED